MIEAPYDLDSFEADSGIHEDLNPPGVNYREEGVIKHACSDLYNQRSPAGAVARLLSAISNNAASITDTKKCEQFLNMAVKDAAAWSCTFIAPKIVADMMRSRLSLGPLSYGEALVSAINNGTIVVPPPEKDEAGNVTREYNEFCVCMSELDLMRLMWPGAERVLVRRESRNDAGMVHELENMLLGDPERGLEPVGDIATCRKGNSDRGTHTYLAYRTEDGRVEIGDTWWSGWNGKRPRERHNPRSLDWLRFFSVWKNP